MIDRLAQLADILPPPAPPPLPAVPWWQGPGPWLLLGAVALALVVAAWVWAQGRAWRRLRAQARTAGGQTVAVPQAAAALAAALRARVPETDWPQPLHAAFDTLRYAPQATPQGLRSLCALLEAASRRAARRAWRGHDRARAAFVAATAASPCSQGASEAGR